MRSVFTVLLISVVPGLLACSATEPTGSIGDAVILFHGCLIICFCTLASGIDSIAMLTGPFQIELVLSFYPLLLICRH